MNRKRGAKRGRLSAQGDISFHATYDRHAFREAIGQDNKAGEEMIHVGEIVFARIDRTSSSMRKLKARPGGATISVCAALPVGDVGDQEKFPGNQKYVGVAKTKLDARRSPKEQRFVVQCGGLATIRLPIVNEGKPLVYCVGDLLLCKLPCDKKDVAQRVCLTTDNECTNGSLCRGDLALPIVGRCLGNGRSGDTMDVILSGNAPGIYCLPS